MRAVAEANAAAAANIPGYFDAPGYNGRSLPVNVEGMLEIYTPNKDPSVATNCYYDPKKPDVSHKSDGRLVLAQLYGSEPPVTELP